MAQPLHANGSHAAGEASAVPPDGEPGNSAGPAPPFVVCVKDAAPGADVVPPAPPVQTPPLPAGVPPTPALRQEPAVRPFPELPPPAPATRSGCPATMTALAQPPDPPLYCPAPLHHPLPDKPPPPTKAVTFWPPRTLKSANTAAPAPAAELPPFAHVPLLPEFPPPPPITVALSRMQLEGTVKFSPSEEGVVKFRKPSWEKATGHSSAKRSGLAGGVVCGGGRRVFKLFSGLPWDARVRY